jgi:hypothetical protein
MSRAVGVEVVRIHSGSHQPDVAIAAASKGAVKESNTATRAD